MAYGMLQLSSLLDCQLPGVALRNLLLNNLQQDFPSQIALMDYSQFLAMACFKEPSQCESENNANSTMLQAAATALMLMVETILK